MKCKFKSILALALALMMCVTMLPTAAFAAASEAPDKIINTAAELVAFANEVNDESNPNSYAGKLVVLGNDINMSGVTDFTPIGTWNDKYDHPFAGTFDGQGHKISNLTMTVENSDADNAIIRVGLFGWVKGNNAVVTNLTLENFNITNNSTRNSKDSFDDKNESSVGLAVATLEDGKVSNVNTTASCVVTGNLRTGGIVGDARSTNSRIENCTNLAKVVGKGLYTGGILGAAHEVAFSSSAMGTQITGCVNGIEDSSSDEGNVSGTTNVGGIVGYADRAIVKSCKNFGTITGPGDYGTGGIMGCNAYNPFSFLVRPRKGSEISGCLNDAKIVGGRAGGILGAYIVTPGQSQPSNDVVCSITGCTSEGTVQGKEGKCGAIFGFQITYAQGDGESSISHLIVKISNCTFSQCVVNNNQATEPTPAKYST